MIKMNRLKRRKKLVPMMKLLVNLKIVPPVKSKVASYSLILNAPTNNHCLLIRGKPSSSLNRRLRKIVRTEWTMRIVPIWVNVTSLSLLMVRCFIFNATMKISKWRPQKMKRHQAQWIVYDLLFQLLHSLIWQLFIEINQLPYIFQKKR